MIVCGVMSGTSADGIDVAMVQIVGRGPRARFTLLAHQAYRYPAAVRKQILATMNARSISVADLARLNALLGELYARAVLSLQKKHDRTCDLVGCHGQTIYHQGEPHPFLGRKITTTWQTGEGAVVAARVGVPVVSDFRQADMAAGGKGAPLVPYFDFLLYRSGRIGRIVQNIGGIGNLTAIPRKADSSQVIAFDTGPGNMVIDALMDRYFDKPYDFDGRIAARGEPDRKLVASVLRGAFFRRTPPKTAGREQFGREFVAQFVKAMGRARKEDIVATATLLTAASIRQSVEDHVLEAAPDGARYREMLISGGGAKNRTLRRMIAEELKPLGIAVKTTDELGLPAEAKEAVAFALLAYQTWRKRPSNIPSATGANGPAVLGKISYA